MRTSYGFILPRDRTPSSAVQAYMQAMRDEEQARRDRETGLEQRHAGHWHKSG